MTAVAGVAAACSQGAGGAGAATSPRAAAPWCGEAGASTAGAVDAVLSGQSPAGALSLLGAGLLLALAGAPAACAAALRISVEA